MSAPEKRLIRSKSGLRILPIKENRRSPFELSEPEWVKDCQSSCCTKCDAKFDFVRRKHHCRRCGQIFCNACSKSRIVLPRMSFLDPVRVCRSCEKITLEEEAFYKNDLKNLTTGVLLEVSDNSLNAKPAVLHCCLSPDHCYLVLSGSESQSIPLTHLAVISNSESDEIQKKLLSKLSFIVSGQNSIMELELPSNCSPSAPAFLWSFQKALQMMEEAKPIIGTGN